MNKILTSLLLFLIIILSIPPLVTIASPMSVSRVSSNVVNEALVAYARYGKDVVYGYIVNDPPGIALIVVHDSYIETDTVLPLDVNLNREYAEVSLDINNVGILIAYRTSTDDIKAVFVDTSGTILSSFTVVSDPSHIEGLPIVKYGDSGIWFIGYMENIGEPDQNYVLKLYQQSGVSFTEIDDTVYKIDEVGYRRQAFYDDNTHSFYIIGRETIGSQKDLVLIGYDILSHSISSIRLTDTESSECYPYYLKMYRRYYAEMLKYGGKILVVFGYEDTTISLDGVVVDLSTATVTHINIDLEMGDWNIRPWISSSTSEWLVSWSYDGSLYVKFVEEDATLHDTIGYSIRGGTRYYDSIINTYNGVDYTLFTRKQYEDYFKLYASRINTLGFASLHGTYIDYKVHREMYVLANQDTESINVALYFKEPGMESYIVIIDSSEILDPWSSIIIDSGRISTRVIYIGDPVRFEGELFYVSNGSGLPFTPITATLYRYEFYDSYTGYGRVEYITETSTKTNSTGGYNIQIPIPENAKPGIYYIDIELPDYLNVSPKIFSSPMFIVLSKDKPSIPWPVDYLPGPSLTIKNGIAVITDPLNEVVSDNRLGVSVKDYVGNEYSDLEVRTIMYSVSKDYFSIRAVFNGSVEYNGRYTPVLVTAVDFTPDNIMDGFGYNTSNNLRLLNGMGLTDTYLKNSSGWDWIIVATPRDALKNVFRIDNKTYSLTMLIANDLHGLWSYVELGAGLTIFDNNEIQVYAPLDIVESINKHLDLTDTSSWRVFSAIYAVDIASGEILNIPGANWFDVPGATTYNTTPTNYINNGFIENGLDDPIKQSLSYELDTSFILNINWSSGRFYAYTKIIYDRVSLNLTGYPTFTNRDVSAYIGTNEYFIRIVDANNTLYGVYERSIQLMINDSSASKETSNLTGYARIRYRWGEDSLGKTYILWFMFYGDTDYIASTTDPQMIVPKYIARILGGTVEYIDNDNKLSVSPGDIMKIRLFVEVWDDSWKPAPPGLKFKIYLNSTPTYLGEAVVSDPGVAELDYMVTGDEGLYDPYYTTHDIIVYGDNTTMHLITLITMEFPYPLGMIPLPEPILTPLLLFLTIFIALLYLKKIK